ncbi:MAG TPA: SseB family protein [Micromonosporaceae bacterium]|nr:SseB family protein [Micromonosporaceae bacterium]
MTEWVPATEAELAMRDALRASDQELYFRILARTELLLPVSADALAGRAPMGWGTWTSGDRTHVLAFTSPQAMAACLAEHAGSARRIAYHELAQSWPNLEWWLAVNPGLPIEGYLPAWFVTQLSRGDVRLPGQTGTRARIERVESFQRTRAVATVPGRRAAMPALPAAPAPALPPSPVPVPAQGGALVGAAVEPATRAVAPAAAAPPPPERAAPPPDGARGRASAPAHAAPPDPNFVPANDVEVSLLAAVEEGNTDSFLSTLLLATVLIPVRPGAPTGAQPGEEGFGWLTETLEDQPYVVVFTSPERLVAHRGAPGETASVRFVHLIRQWPDDQWSFAVNPGTPIGAKLPGTQIVALASWADEVGLSGDPAAAPEPVRPAEPAPRPASAGTAPDPGGETMMQKAIPPGQVDYYLDRGYDRVSGFVHRASEVAHLRTPVEFYAALGLGYAGSQFTRDATELYVLRWAAYRPNLYRIPYGGQHEAGMRAMQGWVIERAPFRGNGFAPGDSSDIVAEFKVDSARLPHGAQLWRVTAEGAETLVALLDADGPQWRDVADVQREAGAA